MTELCVESTRGDVVESIHKVSVAVVNAEGTLLAGSGNPELRTFWRSAAKPFQAIPFVADGAADHFGFGPPALALACASHSSEPAHRALAAAMLRQLGLTEDALACGPHLPRSRARWPSRWRQSLSHPRRFGAIVPASMQRCWPWH